MVHVVIYVGATPGWCRWRRAVPRALELRRSQSIGWRQSEPVIGWRNHSGWPMKDVPKDDSIDPNAATAGQPEERFSVGAETMDRRYRCDAPAFSVGPRDGTVGRVDSVRSSWEKLKRRQPRELAILIDRAAAVRLWLDRSGSEPRVILEDLDRGDYVSLKAVELSDLIIDRQGYDE